MESKAYTIADINKPVETALPIVATAEEPAESGYGAIIIIIGIIALAAVGIAIYRKKATV
jgi:hypothetical protein